MNRYDLNGQQLWSRDFDNPYLSYIYGMAVGRVGVYIAGFANTSSFIRGYDLNGNQLWIRQFGSLLSLNAVTGVSAGLVGLYAVGYDNRTNFVRNYDFGGSLVWALLFGKGPDDVNVFTIADGVYVTSYETLGTPTETGSSRVQKYELNGTLDWTRTCSCGTSGITGDSTGVYAVGTTQTADGTSDGFLAKYDANGNQLWTQSFSPPGLSSFAGLRASADSSGIYLATTTSDGRSIVMKYDENGTHLWSVQLPLTNGNAGNKTPGDAISVADEAVYVGGVMTTASSNELAFVALVAKSSSLVFFGVNPPLSFVLVVLSAVLSVICILWFRSRWRKRLLAHVTGGSHPQQGIPSDMYMRV